MTFIHFRSQNINVNAIDSVIFKHCEQWYRQGYSHNVNLGYIPTNKKNHEQKKPRLKKQLIKMPRDKKFKRFHTMYFMYFKIYQYII